MLGVTKPEEAFTKPAAIVDCASWKISRNENGLIAVCVGCKLAAMCKRLKTPSPCRMYCMSAIEGMIELRNQMYLSRANGTAPNNRESWEVELCLLVKRLYDHGRTAEYTIKASLNNS